MDKRWFGGFRSFFGKKWSENGEMEENENDSRQQYFEKHTPSQNSRQSFPLETEENRFEALFSGILENFPSWDIGTRIHVPEIPAFSYEFTPPDYSQRQSPANNLSNGKRRRSRDEFFSPNDRSDRKEGKDYFHQNPNAHIDDERVFSSPSVPFFGHFDDHRPHNKYDKRDDENSDPFYSLFDRSFPFGEHSNSIDSLFGGILEEFEQMERQFFGDGIRGGTHVFDRDGPAKGRERKNPFDIFLHDEEHGSNLPPLIPHPRNKNDYDGSADVGSTLPPQRHQKIYARSYSSRSYTDPNGEKVSETTKTDSSGKQTITTRRQRGNEIHTEVKERDEMGDEWRIVSNLFDGDKHLDETSNNPQGIIGEIFGHFFAGHEKNQPAPQEIVWERPKVHQEEEDDGDQDYV